MGKTCVLFRFSEDAFNSTFISTIGWCIFVSLATVLYVLLLAVAVEFRRLRSFFNSSFAAFRD